MTDATEVTLLDAEALDFEFPEPASADPPAPSYEPAEALPVPADTPTPRAAPSPRQPTAEAPAQADAPVEPDTPAPAETPAPTETGTAEPAARPGAGSLLDLRGGSDSRPAQLPRPSDYVPKISHGPPPSPVGPELPPSRPRATDREPRSLAEAGFKPHRDGTYRYRDKSDAFKAVIHPNGRVEFKLKVSQLYRLGLVDAARAGSGEELFARAKKELLARTFQLRLNMAVGWAEAQMDTQLKALYRQLLETWKKHEWSAPRRRKQIFTLWDDCEESLELDAAGVDASINSRLDKARRKAGNKARAKIVEFIGRHLPAESQDAYTDAELRTLNGKRQSRQKFKPYDKADKG